jgi:hypothetical protein
LSTQNPGYHGSVSPWRIGLWCLLVAGCDQLFNLAPIATIGAGDDGGTGDPKVDARTDQPQITSLVTDPQQPIVEQPTQVSVSLVGTPGEPVYLEVTTSDWNESRSTALDASGAASASLSWVATQRGPDTIKALASYAATLDPANTHEGGVLVLEAFGAYGPLGEAAMVAADSVVMTRIGLPTNATIHKIGLDMLTATRVRFGIYADNGGGPGQRLAETVSHTAPGGRFEVLLAHANQGSLWIAFLCADPCTVRTRPIATTESTLVFPNQPFASGMPTTFATLGQASTNTHANYVLVE